MGNTSNHKIPVNQSIYRCLVNKVKDEFPSWKQAERTKYAKKLYVRLFNNICKVSQELLSNDDKDIASKLLRDKDPDGLIRFVKDNFTEDKLEFLLRNLT